MNQDFEIKYQLGRKAYQNAYAKYSKFQVGAVLFLQDGHTILGSNVENASYGLTNCAERSALFAAYSQGYRQADIQELVIFASGPRMIFPCGACRQVISELMLPDAIVTLINIDRRMQSVTVKELLPFAFTEEDINHDTK